MSTVTLHLEPVIDENALARVKSTLPQIEKNDHLTITLEAADAHQADRIMEVLGAYGFEYQPRGSHDGRDYHIIASRL